MPGTIAALKGLCCAVAGYDHTIFIQDLYHADTIITQADLHVIMPDKFVAFKGPHATTYYKDGVQFLAPRQARAHTHTHMHTHTQTNTHARTHAHARTHTRLRRKHV